MISISKETKNSYICSVLVLLMLTLSFFNQNKFIISYNNHYHLLLFSKICLLGATYFAIKYFQRVEIKITKENLFFICLIVIFGGYFTFWLIGQYPGYIMTDSYETIFQVMNLDFTNWFSSIHPFLYLILFQIIPHPIVVPIFQIILSSIIFSLIINKIYKVLGLVPALFLFLLIFSSVPIIVNTIFYTRDTIYGVLHLLLIYFIFDSLTTDNTTQKRLICIISISLLLSIYRSEGILLLFLVPFSFFIMKKISFKKTLIISVTSILFFIPLSFTLDKLLSIKNVGNYKLTLIMNPLGYLIQNNYFTVSGEKDMEIISNVLDVPKVKELSTPYEIPAYWAGAWDWKKSDKDYSKLYQLFFRMVGDNIPLFINNRILNFLASTGFSDSGGLYYLDGAKWSTENKSYQLIQEKFALKNDLFPNVKSFQNKIIEFTLKFKGANGGRILFWNFVPFIAILSLLILLYKWVPISSICSIIILYRVPIIFLISPGSQFKYYYSVYLFGLIAIFFAFTEYKLKKRTLNEVHG